MSSTQKHENAGLGLSESEKHPISLRSLGPLIWDSDEVNEMKSGIFTQRENAAYERLELELKLLCGDTANIDMVMDRISDYACVVENLNFNLGIKVGAALYRCLTEDLDSGL